MIISLVRMPPDGLAFRHQYKAGELDTREYDFELKEPPLVYGRAMRAGPDMRLRGELKAAITAPCDRCLKEVTIPVEIPFDLFYAPADPGAGQPGGRELSERDLDFAVYENDQIDLDGLVLEQLELELPSRTLCSEDCRGLCPQCGADLNVEKCDCKAQVDPDGRFWQRSRPGWKKTIKNRGQTLRSALNRGQTPGSAPTILILENCHAEP